LKAAKLLAGSGWAKVVQHLVNVINIEIILIYRIAYAPASIAAHLR
jgi:hypothetical protein